MPKINNLDELASLDDIEFITVLYRIVLRREPDGSGMEHGLSALRNGADKRAMVIATALSAEGRQFKPTLAGLSEAILWQRRERSLPLGPFYRILHIAKRAYRLINRLDGRLANIERTLSTPIWREANEGSSKLPERRNEPFEATEILVPAYFSARTAKIYKRLKKVKSSNWAERSE